MTDLAQAQARILELEAEVDRLTNCVATLESPFRRHAAGPDSQPPLRFSVEESRRIVREADYA